MSLRTDINDTPVVADPEVLIPHVGAWATVSTVDGSTVTVTIADFDGDEHYFGPVPFLPSDATLSPGDAVFLHFDGQGRPGIVIVDAATGSGLVVDGGSPTSSEGPIDGGTP